MINFKKICVFDFETNSTDPTIASPIQIGALIIEPRKLEVIPDAAFNSLIRPDIETTERGTLEFHARRLNKEPDVLLEEWKTYPDPKLVWENFRQFLSKYHTKQDRQTIHTAPIAAGMNILEFDIPIAKRYNDLYGEGKHLFAARDKIDLMHWFFPWFESNQEVERYTLDFIREYLGMPTTNAHDAFQDVKDSADIIIRFLRLHRRIAEKTQFKGSFKK